MNAGSYARSALERECDQVRNMPEGGRNVALNRAAFAVSSLWAGLAARGEPSPIGEQAAREQLEAAGVAAGLPLREARQTVNSGWKSGQRSPRVLEGAPLRPAPAAPRPVARSRPAPAAPAAPKVPSAVAATWADWCALRSLDAGRVAQAFGVRQHGRLVCFPAPPNEPLRTRLLDLPRPRESKSGWTRKGGRACAYGLSQALALPAAGPVYVVNGEPSVWAAWQSGVPALCWCIGEGSTPDADELRRALEALAGRPVRVVYDLDGAGRTGALEVAGVLRAAGFADVQALELPAELGTGGDVDDLHRRTGDDGLAAALLALPVLEAPPPAGLPDAFQLEPDPVPADRAPVTYREGSEADTHRQICATFGERAQALNVYARGGALVQAQGGRLSPLSHHTLPVVLSDAVELQRPVTRNGEQTMRPIRLSATDAHALLERRDWEAHGVPPLLGVLQHPWFGPDGTIMHTPGYDARTGYLLAPHNVRVTVPSLPTRDDAQRAVAALFAPLDEVPWATVAGDDEGAPPQGFSTWLAALMTLVALPALPDLLPVWVISANASHAGKSQLVQLLALLTTGERTSPLTWGADADEQTKVLLSVALAPTGSVCLFDNVRPPATIGGATLEGLVTAGRIAGRKLGSTATLELPWRSLLAFTSNHASVTPDMRPRTLWLELNTPDERPDERRFKISDLQAHVLENRAALLSAALTIWRAWHVAGRPTSPPLPDRGNFGRWSAVRHALVWAGLPDPWADAARVPFEADDDTADLARVLAAWAPDADGIKVANMVADTDLGAALRDVLPDAFSSNPANFRKIGKWLASHAGRVLNGRVLRRRENPRDKVTLWRVETAGSGARG